MWEVNKRLEFIDFVHSCWIFFFFFCKSLHKCLSWIKVCYHRSSPRQEAIYLLLFCTIHVFLLAHSSPIFLFFVFDVCSVDITILTFYLPTPFQPQVHMKSYQKKCLNEASLGISTLCGLFPLSDDEDVNTILVPNVVCITDCG